MANKKQPRGAGSPAAVIKTLDWLRREGFKPVALHPRSKAAVDKRYTELDYSPPSDDAWHTRDLNIGVVLGPQRGGPVDVDLDCSEALACAEIFLPQTPATFGRKSAPASHRLYRVSSDSMPKVAFTDPLRMEEKTIVEIRGDGGHQTVLPGSTHQDSGEAIRWERAMPDIAPGGTVATVDPEDLLKRVQHLAMACLIARHAWMEGQRNLVNIHISGMLFYLDWKVEEAERLITAVMRITGDDDETRLKTLRTTFKKGEQGKRITGATSLRKLLGDDKVVDRLMEWSGADALSHVQEYNERYAAVMVEGKFRVADLEQEPSEPPIFMGRDDFLSDRAWDVGTTSDGKAYQKALSWLRAAKRRSYRSVDFRPGVVEDDGRMLNLWTGWRVPPGEGSCDAWLELLHKVICGGDDTLNNWMLNWFANILRKPMDQTRTAPVLIGIQGAGKSLLMSYFGEILGSGYFHATNDEHVHGKFNKHLATVLLLHADEALYAGDKKHAGIIKSLITDEFRVFEPKNIDAKRVRNYLRMALTSNNLHAAPAEAGDRRYTVIDLERRILTEELKQRVVDEKKTTGPAALHRYLREEFDYDDAVARTTVKNAALGMVKAIGQDPCAAWWRECLEVGAVLPDYLAWAQKDIENPWPGVVSSTAMHVALRLHCKNTGARSVPSPALMAVTLDKLTGTTLTRAQRTFDNPICEEAPPEVRSLSGRHSTVLNLPSLAQCRAAFEAWLGQPVNWPADDDGSGREKKPRRY